MNIWAAAIVHTIAGVNFAYDKSQTPHITMDTLCEALGAAKSTVGNKAPQIRRLLDIDTFDSAWTVPGQMEKNPMIWLPSVNGLLVDIRPMPIEAQRVAYEKGLIPYIPALRGAQNADEAGDQNR